MRDYAEQVKELRDFAEEFDLEDHTETAIMLANAADAIEELLITTSAQKETIGVLRARNSAQADMLDGEWASVEEQLPEKHKTVLFYIPWNKSDMVGWRDEGGQFWLKGYGEVYEGSLVNPSHWMPLPKPPKEVE